MSSGVLTNIFCKTVPKTTAEWLNVPVLSSVSRAVRGRYGECFLAFRECLC